MGEADFRRPKHRTLKSTSWQAGGCFGAAWLFREMHHYQPVEMALSLGLKGCVSQAHGSAHRCQPEFYWVRQQHIHTASNRNGLR